MFLNKRRIFSLAGDLGGPQGENWSYLRSRAEGHPFWPTWARFSGQNSIVGALRPNHGAARHREREKHRNRE